MKLRDRIEAKLAAARTRYQRIPEHPTFSQSMNRREIAREIHHLKKELAILDGSDFGSTPNPKEPLRER